MNGSVGSGPTGTGGSTASTGTGGAASTDGGIPDGGCKAAAGRAFPQHAGYPGCADCIHPNVPQATMDADVASFYDGWKGAMLKKVGAGDVANEYVVRAGANGAIDGWPAGVSPVTQSEGHGYGMLIVALMAGHDVMAKTNFDSMNRVRKAFPASSDPRLMSWVVPNNGDKTVKPQPPATDGDMDMAYALLLAFDQWGDEANNHYLADAKSIIAGMEAQFITMGSGQYFPRLNIGDPAHLGSAPPESKPAMTRPSDFMIDHMHAFAKATGHALWNDLATGSLNILKQVRNAATGLVPDFVVDSPPAASTTGTADEGLCYQCYDYNSCRVPFRQAVTIVNYGDAAARDVAAKMVAWARTKWSDSPSAMTSVFQLNGTAMGSGKDSAFTSPMVAGAIADTGAQKWLDAGWAYMASSTKTAYYGGSLTLMSMIALSGNWWVPTAGACTP